MRGALLRGMRGIRGIRGIEVARNRGMRGIDARGIRGMRGVCVRGMGGMRGMRGTRNPRNPRNHGARGIRGIRGRGIRGLVLRFRGVERARNPFLRYNFSFAIPVWLLFSICPPRNSGGPLIFANTSSCPSGRLHIHIERDDALRASCFA